MPFQDFKKCILLLAIGDYNFSKLNELFALFGGENIEDTSKF